MNHSEILPLAGAIEACTASIAGAGDIRALAACAVDARALAAALHREDAGAALVTRMLSAVNDRIAKRVLDLLASRFRLPPARWCWLRSLWCSGCASRARTESAGRQAAWRQRAAATAWPSSITASA